jgi:hypothetical protein
MLLPNILFAQEQLSYMAERETVASDWNGTRFITINAGDLLNVTASDVDYGVRFNNSGHNELDEFHLIILFGEQGNRLRALAKDFHPLNTEYTFGADIFIDYPMDRRALASRQVAGPAIVVGDTNKMWVPAYYRDVLAAQSRDMLVQLVPTLNLHTDGEFVWYDSTFADIQHGRAMFYNSIIRLGTDTHLPVRNIRRTDFGYIVDCVVSILDRHNPRHPIFPESIFWKIYQPGDSLTLYLHLDGDYLDIYTANDIHVGTFIRVGREFITQYQRLIRHNTNDLTNVIWPQRADGTRHFIPPVIELAPRLETAEAATGEITDSDAQNQTAEIASVVVSAVNDAPNSMPWVWVVIGGAAVIGAVVLYFVRRKK